MSECRFIFTYAPSSAKAAIACKTHAAGASDDPCGSDYPAPALCTHAAAALRADRNELRRRVEWAGVENVRLQARVEQAETYMRRASDDNNRLRTERLTLEARVLELEAMWAAKAEVGDARIARAEQRVRELEGQVTEWTNKAVEAREAGMELPLLQKRLSRAEQTVARLREALTDRRSGRPQCRGCYEYLDKPEPKHTDSCWAAAALSPQEPPNAP